MKFTKSESRKRRHFRVRNKISGTASRPRLCVSKSNTNFYAQIIDDTKGVTLVSASSLKLPIKGNKGNVEAAVAVADDLAKKAKAAKIEEVVFDRGGNLYHGRVKAFAEQMRKDGIKF